MASSTQGFRDTKVLIRERTRGNVTVSEWERLANISQVEYASALAPGLAMLDTMSAGAFLKTYIPVQLTNGVGSYDFPELLKGALPFMSVAASPECGGEAPVPVLRPISLMTDSEFGTATGSKLTPPTWEFPIARLLPGKRIEVRPASITYIECLCWRIPRPIKVGIDPQITAYDQELEGGQGQVDPEWDDDSFNKILLMILEKSGVSLGDAGLVNAAQALRQ